MSSKTVLVIDDQTHVRMLIREYLTQESFRVLEADNGKNGLILARQEKPSIILLDIMMPEMGGFEFIKVFRKESKTPIILLTAKQEETDKVLGLELGADDYITKPFSVRELAARIHAVMRRAENETVTPSDILKAADVVVNRRTYTVSIAGNSITVTPSEFELLAAMIASPGRVFTRAQLLDRLQGTDGESIERTIDVHIRNLRAKIEPEPSSPRYIETVFGVGYRFRADDTP